MISESNESHRSHFFEEVVRDTPGGRQLALCLQ